MPSSGGVDKVVGRIDEHHRRLDLLQVRGGIVIARSVDCIKHVVSVDAVQTAIDVALDEKIRLIASRIILLPLERSAARNQQKIQSRANPL